MNHSEISARATREDTFCIGPFAGEPRTGRREPQILGEPRTILLVEDEAFVREVASEVLSSAGYRVLAAKDAAEAWRIFDEADPEIDLLLTDVILPGEDGRRLAERLRGRNRLLPVLLATGYGEHMAREAGEPCLAKPFSSEDLLGKVRELLETAPPRANAASCRLATTSGLQNLSWNVA
jgi:two-component system cell cycle sensor histidine kinase/response regulator CckA